MAAFAVLACCGWVAPSEAFVYWADSTGAIGRANLDGSGVTLDFIATAARPLGVAVDGRHVYWSNPSTNAIGRANLDGSGAEPNFLTSVSTAAGVAVDARHIYWSNPSGYIRRANLDGSDVDPFFILVTRGNEPGSVAVDAEHVYWVNERTGTIGRANLDGSGADETFIAGVRRPVALAVDGGPAGIAAPSAASLSFKKQPVGTFGPPASVTITNEGHGNLRIDAARVIGGDVNDFLVSHDTCSQRTLTIAATCTVYVRFGPIAAGDRQATLALTSDDPAAPLQIGLRGTGG